MKTAAILISLAATLAHAQNMTIRRGAINDGFADGPSLITEAPEEITVGEELKMYELVATVNTNKNQMNSTLRVTVTHKHKIAQKPAVLAAQYDPVLIRELYKLRQSFVGLINRVAYESADVRMEGMPNRVTTRYGHTRTNVFKKSDRDKENIEHRAEQSAILQLQRLTGALFRVRTYGMTDRITHHYRIPDGEYMICVMQRVKDPNSKSMMGSKWALWWTKVLVEKEKPKELVFDETNAISWDEIFEIN